MLYFYTNECFWKNNKRKNLRLQGKHFKAKTASLEGWYG